MSEETDFLDLLKLCAWGGAFGAAGGVVRIVRFGAKSFWNILAQIIVSGFCGICAYSLLSGSGVTDMMMVGVCGIAGNSGGMILDAVQSQVVRKIRGG